ncbi:MAG: acetylornithine deacetylase [Caulobacteraceae bacterium]
MDAPSPETVDHLSALIGFDTTSRNSNLALIDWAAERLEALGARLRHDYNSDRSKANLFATFGEGEGGVVLSGHTDVVPVDGQSWRSDPFKAEIRDDRLYGRGACDMKAFIGVVMAKAPTFAQASLRDPIHIALTYDEEQGCLGVPGLVADIQRAGIQPNGCIVGEPTDMRVVAAHKGGRIYRCCVSGVAAHSSLTPHGVNAIEYAAKLIAHIQDLADREETDGVRQDGYDVPFSTISTNVISGGNGNNIVPAECEFFFEYRFLPGLSPDHFIDAIHAYADNELLPRMRARSPKAGIEFECIGRIPPLDTKDTDDILRLALALSGENGAGRVAYGTEAPFFAGIGIPSIICGPGSIQQAHKPDEFVSLEQLAICERFLDRLVGRLSR